MAPQPPRLAVLVTRLRRRGPRGAEFEADLRELFDARVAELGPRYARRAYWRDAFSLWVHVSPSWQTLLEHSARARPSSNRAGRDVLRHWALDTVWRDVVYATRVFGRQRGTVGLTVAGMALAIGVATATFSVLNAVLIRPLGVPDPGATVIVWRTWQGGAARSWPYADYLRTREAARRATLEGWIRDAGPMGLTPLEVMASTTPVHLVTGGYFSTFGIRAAFGRGLTPDDDRPGAPLVAVVSHAFWRHRFDGDPAMVGRSVYFFGERVIIVGVADRTFTGPAVDVPAFWLPLVPSQAVWSSQGPLHPASRAQVLVFARVRSDTPLAPAEAELSALVARMPPSGDAQVATGVSFVPADDRGGPQIRIVIAVVMTAVGLVLLLACANIANLLLASAATREREIGVRLALGAGRRRIVRQLLTESAMVAAAGGAVGLVAVIWILPVVAMLGQVPETLDVTPDWRVYGFAILTTLATGLGAGIAPARYGTRGHLLAVLSGDNAQAGGRSSGRTMRSALVGAQAAASILLLVMTALLSRAAIYVSQVDLGFDAEHLASVAPHFGRVNYDATRTAQYWDVALERVRGLSGVRAAALVEHLPFGDSTRPMAWQSDGRQFVVNENRTSAEYFATAGIRIVSGRAYSPDEVRSGAPVAVVSESLAREVWGGADPVGGTLTAATGSARIVRIVGVARDTTYVGRIEQTHTLYRPLAGEDVVFGRIVVRTEGDVSAIVRPLRDALQTIDPALTISVGQARDALARGLHQARSLAALAAVAGGLALALALIGLFGVTSFVVSQRMREAGVRIAIGATARDIRRLLLRDALRPVVVGLAIGLLGALAGGQVIAGVLYGVSPRDPIALAGAASVLLGAAVLAVLVPARRAARVDPAAILRQG